jgi:hypothetical protein
MISQDLEHLRRYLHDRAFRREPLTLNEMHQVADALEAMLAPVRAMESTPIPSTWRVIDGGRTIEPPPRTA